MSFTLAMSGVAMHELLDARDRRRLQAGVYQKNADELLARVNDLHRNAVELLKEAEWLDEACNTLERAIVPDATLTTIAA